ncbi:MAG: hypothetical protein AAF813_07240 [Pseudomonadota bacterium]
MPSGMGTEKHPNNRPKRVVRERLRLRSGPRVIDVLEAWADGFAILREGPQPDRGFVDMFDGEHHIRHGLVFQTGIDGDRALYTFKLAQDPRMAQPADFERAKDGPAALLTRD